MKKKHNRDMPVDPLAAVGLANPGQMEKERILRCEDTERTYGLMMKVHEASKSCEAQIRALSDENAEIRGALTMCIDSLTKRAAGRAPSHAAAALAPVSAPVSAPNPAPVSGPAPAASKGKGKAPATKLAGENTFLSAPRVPDLLMAVDSCGQGNRIFPTPYAFVHWDKSRQNWKGGAQLKGTKGKAKTKSFSTDKAAAVHVAEQWLGTCVKLTGHNGLFFPCLPSPNRIGYVVCCARSPTSLFAIEELILSLS
jgi:hypothetical protein